MAEHNIIACDEEEEFIEPEKLCPMEGCENKQDLKNKKGRCDRCHTWWYENKRIFFGPDRRCKMCQEIFFPDTRDAVRDKEGYMCDKCIV
jgi:hypothetical protein